MAELTTQILELVNKGPVGLEEPDRLALLQASQKLSEALENPVEKFIRLLFAIYDPIAIRLAVDLDLVDIALTHSGPISLRELAQKSKADAQLLQRIMRMLVPLGIFTETESSVYTPTVLAPVLATGSPLKEAVVHITHLYHTVAAVPEYLATNNYKNPEDATAAPFSFAHSCNGDTYFDFISKPGNDRLASAFNATMEMQKSKDDVTFVEAYPAGERLQNDDPERVLFVDVGGSLGHQVRKFQERYASIPGKLVLEDLPNVVEKAVDVPDSIVKIGHDFFTPQPGFVKNAKAFYLRMILHDWPERQAKVILSHIVDVMAEDSVVLIHEFILRENQVSLFEAKMDMHMMNLGAMERTEKQWMALANSVGLEVRGIWWEVQGLDRIGLIEMGKKV